MPLMQSKPLKRKTPIRKAAKKRKKTAKATRDPYSKPWKKKCDKAWSKRIVAIGRCAICEKSNCQLHAHHLISRAILFFRHNLENGICLCAHCHNFNLHCSPHASPWAFEEWMAENRPEQYGWWVKNRHKVITGVRINYGHVYEQLTADCPPGAARQKGNPGDNPAPGDSGNIDGRHLGLEAGDLSRSGSIPQGAALPPADAKETCDGY